MRIWQFYILLLLISGMFFSACHQQEKKQRKVSTSVQKWDQTIPGNFSTQTTAIFDSARVDTFINHYPLFKPYSAEISSFYHKRKFAYAWYEKGSLIEQAENLANRVLNLQHEGVYQPTPYQQKLDSLLFNRLQKKADIELELMLTAQYFAFSRMAWDGLNPSVSKASSWFVPRKKMNYEDYLDSLLSTPSGKQTKGEPVYRQYELLRRFLKKYNDLDSLEKWEPVIANKTLKAGDSLKVIAQIKRRLCLLDDFRGDTTSAMFNDELREAVKQFQQRNGLSVTGSVGKGTLTELNVPLKQRITQILVNMERSRWLPVSLNSDYLGVNIPEFKLHVYHADSLVWSCNVVVGQVVHKTTVFYGEIKYIVFSPYWNIPPGILKSEVIPKMKKNPGYLAAHNMIQAGYEGGLPVIKQKPGPDNSLGLVKFLFPNNYNIYLHDTPSKSLFGETSRAFSHGCIRVGEPARLANFLLRNNTVWDTLKIDKAMHSGKEQTVVLKDKVPVFITYFTAFIDRENKLNFRKDIYDLDKSLAETIISGKGKY